MLVYFMSIWYILMSFGIFYGHLVHVVVIWYIFSRFGMLQQEKSGIPARKPSSQIFHTRENSTSRGRATLELRNTRYSS
jgi:hypothetical protein